MKFYVGTTDFSWYSYLSTLNPEDVNFWKPGGKQNFNILTPGAPFLFKLKSPYNAIGGIGFFSSFTFLPLSIAWDTFENRNGSESLEELRKLISTYRKGWWDFNPTIGCIVLTNPIFFNQSDWIPTPEDWSNSIVQGKSYSTADAIGNKLWSSVNLLLPKYLTHAEENKSQLQLENIESSAYGKNVLSKVRLGQGAFRVLLTDAYSRKCSISGEKTLPALEAAHIKPYSKSGPHYLSNGLLLRADLHKLFDLGYLTITNGFTVEVSNRIKEEFENGKDYYKYHGSNLIITPNRYMDKPNSDYIDWHNSNVFKQ